MEHAIPDHVLAAILVLLDPPFGILWFRWLKRAVGQGRPAPRIRGYQVVLAWEWSLTVALLGFWWAAGRPFPDLGLGFRTGAGFWIGSGLVLAGVAALILHVRALGRNPEQRAKLRDQLEALSPMLPRDAAELRWFLALSVTAGICEEVLYRGFLIDYTSAVVGTTGAVFLSSLVFGLAHAYQGPGGVIKTCVVGLVTAGLYVLTGSLWAPMLLHVSIDATSGIGIKSLLER